MNDRGLDRTGGPLASFFRSEAAGGVAVALAAVVALTWANSPWSGAYEALWGTPVRVGAPALGLEKPLVVWVNDLLMAVFFLLVGVEIKRELVTGELDTPRKAALPVVAALGGMLVPVGVFMLLAREGPAARGWGIPMATDIAFALGVARLLGARAPAALIVLLTALAVIDDLGAIVIIAVFYAGDLSLEAHVAALALTLVLVAMNRLGVRRPGWYVLVGAPLWLAVLKSGVHATLAGVVVGLAVPARGGLSVDDLLARARHLLGEAQRDPGAAREALSELGHCLEDSEPPVRRLEHRLHPLVAFVILPTFALANAGVSLRGLGAGDLAAPATLGVALGLALGKPIGVIGAVWLAVRTGLSPLPAGMTWRHVGGVGLLAGIGFTMSLFVAGLAYQEGSPLHRQAKVGVLAASALAATLGVLVLRSGPPPAAIDDARPRA